MNIFYLSQNYKQAAIMHIDKHVVKMIIEYAQLLSTCHRILDGNLYYDTTKNGRSIKRWKHPSNELNNNLYKASHINHPSNIWVRQSRENYIWLYKLWRELCKEYTYRYGKIHLTQRKLHKYLKFIPNNIPRNIGITKILLAMPEQYKRDNPIESYRLYYINEKKDFSKWTKRNIPNWFIQL